MDVFSIGSAVHLFSQIFRAESNAALLNRRGLEHLASPLLLGGGETIVLSDSSKHLTANSVQSPNVSSQAATLQVYIL